VKASPTLQRANYLRSREPFVIESVSGPTVYLNHKGVNIGRDAANGFRDYAGPVIRLPRVKWLERGAPRK